MRVSLSILFLGWWLTRQRWMARGQRYPKPSISVSPSAVVALGGNVTISCKSKWYQHMEIFLYKEESGNWQKLNTKVAEKDEATFPITNAKHSDEGAYRCVFRGSSPLWSSYGEKVYIKIREQFYPKPSISVRPNEVVALGETASIHCKSEKYRQADFSLIKEGALDIIQVKTADWEEAVFSIGNANRSDVGIYWCQYRCNSDHRYSYFSERVYINITDPSLSKPIIKMKPEGQQALGVNVTIECQGPEETQNFYLYKEQDQIVSLLSEPDGSTAKFLFHSVTLEDTGSYTCRYHLNGNPFVWSEPSEAVELILRVSTSMQTIRLGVASFILFILMLIVAEAIYSWKK